jgi:hypothetical protein
MDRRQLLTAAVALTAASSVSNVTATEDVCEAVQSCILPPEGGVANVSAATTRRLLEIRRRNEVRRQAQLPLLSIPKELRRMKQQEEWKAFRRFEAVNGRTVWEQVLEARRLAEGNSNWRPSWMVGMGYQNQVHAVLRARFEPSGKTR